MAQWINILRNNGFVNPTRLLFCVKKLEPQPQWNRVLWQASRLAVRQADESVKRQLTLFDTIFSSRQSKSVRSRHSESMATTDIPCSSSSTANKEICVDISKMQQNVLAILYCLYLHARNTGTNVSPLPPACKALL